MRFRTFWHAVFFFLFFIFLTASNLVSAEVEDSEYYFIIEENGNTIVAVTFYGEGEITMPIQTDVQSLNMEGGLYIMENNELTIAIGSTEKAVLVYKTNLLTEKIGEDWKFSLEEFETQTDKNVAVAMPAETIVSETSPTALVKSGEFMELSWENPQSIAITYHFPITSIETDEENINNILIYLIAGIAVLGVSFAYLFYSSRKKHKKPSARQEQLLQTLTENEKKIIQLLLENKNPVKRSFIERKLELAKSSLAATLNNLERKKILEIDKTFSSHFIKITDWFRKL